MKPKLVELNPTRRGELFIVSDGMEVTRQFASDQVNR